MGWKDVPMPPRIAALPKDKRGFPVPWISDWEDGAVDAEGRAWTITEGHPIYGTYTSACTHTDGVGEPNLGALCAPRQIQGMIQRLCDVCGVKVGKTAFFMGNESLVETGYYELPLHLECALYAGQVCPGLVTRAQGEIWVSAAKEYVRKPRRKFIDGDYTFESLDDDRWRLMEHLKGSPSILIGVVAVPLDAKKWPLEDFLGQHGLKHPYRQEITA